jgi:opacity protein-like surface antigen
MKLKTLLLTTALLTSTASADAVAPYPNNTSNQFEDFYGKLEAGISSPSTLKRNNGTKVKFKNSFVGALGGGYKFNEFFRTDLMFQYRNIKSKSGSTLKGKSYSAMLNGHLDAHNDTIFTPYLMAGLGAGRIKFKGYKTSIGINWNAGLGAQAKIHDQASIDLGYRYVSLAKAKPTKKRFTAHEAIAGLIWHL